MQQPAGEQETSVAAAKATATEMAMATGNALVPAAEAAAALIADDADSGNSSVTIVGRASRGGWANKLIPLFICCRHYNFYLY